MVFDRCVIIYTSNASACGICVKNISYEYTLCVVPWILARGYIHRTQFEEHLKLFVRAFKNSSLEHLGLFEEHLKTIWCVIAARSRYGIGRDDDESKLA